MKLAALMALTFFEALKNQYLLALSKNMDEIKFRLPTCSPRLIRKIRNSLDFMNSFLDTIYDALFSNEINGDPELLTSVLFALTHSNSQGLCFEDPDDLEICKSIFRQNFADRNRIMDLCRIALEGNVEAKQIFFENEEIRNSDGDYALKTLDIPQDGFLHDELRRYNRIVEDLLSEGKFSSSMKSESGDSIMMSDTSSSDQEPSTSSRAVHFEEETTFL